MSDLLGVGEMLAGDPHHPRGHRLPAPEALFSGEAGSRLSGTLEPLRVTSETALNIHRKISPRAHRQLQRQPSRPLGSVPTVLVAVGPCYPAPALHLLTLTASVPLAPLPPPILGRPVLRGSVQVLAEGTSVRFSHLASTRCPPRQKAGAPRVGGL